MGVEQIKYSPSDNDVNPARAVFPFWDTRIKEKIEEGDESIEK
jgi:hypothetical protein